MLEPGVMKSRVLLDHSEKRFVQEREFTWLRLNPKYSSNIYEEIQRNSSGGLFSFFYCCFSLTTFKVKHNGSNAFCKVSGLLALNALFLNRASAAAFLSGELHIGVRGSML